MTTSHTIDKRQNAQVKSKDTRKRERNQKKEIKQANSKNSKAANPAKLARERNKKKKSGSATATVTATATATATVIRKRGRDRNSGYEQDKLNKLNAMITSFNNNEHSGINSKSELDSDQKPVITNIMIESDSDSKAAPKTTTNTNTTNKAFRKFKMTETQLQPRKGDYNGQGLARDSLFIALNDPSFVPLFNEQFMEHVDGFFGKAKTKGMKKEANKNTLWKKMQVETKGGLTCDERVEKYLKTI